jgi:hypothetical protein
MRDAVRTVAVLRSAGPSTRCDLILEILALHHQLAVLGRSDRRCRPSDRLFWVCLRLWWPRWRETLVLVPAGHRRPLAARRVPEMLEPSAAGTPTHRLRPSKAHWTHGHRELASVLPCRSLSRDRRYTSSQCASADSLPPLQSPSLRSCTTRAQLHAGTPRRFSSGKDPPRSWVVQLLACPS